jgi:hypothetical protein
MTPKRIFTTFALMHLSVFEVLFEAVVANSGRALNLQTIESIGKSNREAGGLRVADLTVAVVKEQIVE